MDACAVKSIARIARITCTHTVEDPIVLLQVVFGRKWHSLISKIYVNKAHLIFVISFAIERAISADSCVFLFISFNNYVFINNLSIVSLVWNLMYTYVIKAVHRMHGITCRHVGSVSIVICYVWMTGVVLAFSDI